MCQHGDTVRCRVTVPAELSYTGKQRVAYKDIDNCIAPFVKALNRIGMLTANCCCGHGQHRPSILLADGRVIVICEAPNDELALALIPELPADGKE